MKKIEREIVLSDLTVSGHIPRALDMKWSPDLAHDARRRLVVVNVGDGTSRAGLRELTAIPLFDAIFGGVLADE